MKWYRALEYVNVALVSAGLISLYSVGYLTYRNHGHWPTYNNPQSWSSAPAEDFYGPFMIYLFFLCCLISNWLYCSSD